MKKFKLNKLKMKKRYYILLLILGVMIYAKIQRVLDNRKPIDGTYYLITRDFVTKKTSIDETNYIKIKNTKVNWVKDGTAKRFKYNKTEERFKNSSIEYYCIDGDGKLLVGKIENGEFSKGQDYISKKSDMYNDYKNGNVTVKE